MLRRALFSADAVCAGAARDVLARITCRHFVHAGLDTPSTCLFVLVRAVWYGVAAARVGIIIVQQRMAVWYGVERPA